MDQRGVTLAELMVVLAIAAILLAVGIPGMNALMRSSRLTAATNDMLASLHLARSEAIKRRSRAVLCPSADGSHCAGDGRWNLGWLVFHDANNNAERDSGEAVIFARAALAAGLRLTGNDTMARYISYSANGGTRRISGAIQAGTLTLCHEDIPAVSREIKINFTGRPRTARQALDACP